MKKSETRMVLAVLVVAFPAFYRGISEADTEAALNLWHQQFLEYPYEVVEKAVQALISTKVEGYPPTIGEVKEQIRRLTTTVTLDENDAWVLVSRACRNGSYHSIEEFNKLPPDVQRTVGSPEQLKQWAGMDADVVESVVASNFKKAFRVQAERAAEISKLPPQIRQQMVGIADNMKMIGG